MPYLCLLMPTCVYLRLPMPAFGYLWATSGKNIGLNLNRPLTLTGICSAAEFEVTRNMSDFGGTCMHEVRTGSPRALRGLYVRPLFVVATAMIMVTTHTGRNFDGDNADETL